MVSLKFKMFILSQGFPYFEHTSLLMLLLTLFSCNIVKPSGLFPSIPKNPQGPKIKRLLLFLLFLSSFSAYCSCVCSPEQWSWQTTEPSKKDQKDVLWSRLHHNLLNTISTRFSTGIKQRNLLCNHSVLFFAKSREWNWCLLILQDITSKIS